MVVELKFLGPNGSTVVGRSSRFPGAMRGTRKAAGGEAPAPRNPLQRLTNTVTNGPHRLVHGFRLRGVDERPFTVCLRHVADALFELRDAILPLGDAR